MSNLKEIETKLGAARTRLVLEKPFIGALVMHLPLVAADPRRCRTAATDAYALYYNPEYIGGLTLAQTQFVLAHEAMHCALAHFARRGHRERRRWDVACDHAVNLLLIADGLQAPAAALANADFRGLAAEEIYPLIPPGTDARTLDDHLFDTGTGQPRYGRPPQAFPVREAPRLFDRAELARRWQGRMVSAAQQARRAGRLAESWLRLIDDLVQPQLPWRYLLARHVMGAAREDYTFQRPPRREGDALLPRLASGEMDLHIALDTSGSIGGDELAQFASEVDALKGQVRARVTLHACDERLDPRGPWRFQAWEPITLPREIGGGGGTRFVPVFDWVRDQRQHPDLLLYFTDAEGEFPRHAPGFPVIWLVKGRARVPWGERIQLN